MKSLSIIKREHRNLNAILFTLERLVLEIGEHNKTVDFVIMHGIIYYLDSFLDRFHHPKETDYLFPAIKTHCPDAKPVLDLLGQQHAQGEQLLVNLLKTLSAYEFLGPAGFIPFRNAANEYVEFERQHAYKEEREVLPLAEQHLTESEWDHIDAAFADNQDPIFGEQPQAEFRELFKALGSLIPAPYGLGPELKSDPERV